MQKQETNSTVVTRESDFSEWYQNVITAADMAEHSDVKGAMIIKPYGYAIWERIQSILDQKIKETGHQNAYFPLFIPKSYLGKEAAHVEGFAKECAVVTHHRLKLNDAGELIVDPEAKLTEELIVRPTSETVIHSAFARWVKSWRDLPLLINQWANVVRWELRPRMFLRTTEFLWQEGHTAHATEAEAEKETLKMLEVYKDFATNHLALAVVPGLKTESEKFAGALRTYTIEAMMQDGKALQAGTSHNLGQNFAKAFSVQYLDQTNQLQYCWMTSWGVSTRLMGGLIMSHSDDKGLVLPPMIAPTQVVIVPILKDDVTAESVRAKAIVITQSLREQGIRVHLDERAHLSLGEKLYEWEKKGVPVRIELGPRDLDQNVAMVARRDLNTKEQLHLDALEEKVAELLSTIQDNLLQTAQARLENQTNAVENYADFQVAIEQGGFFRAFWCGDADCEEQIKQETKATIRCIPFDQPSGSGVCLKCGKESATTVIFAKAY